MTLTERVDEAIMVNIVRSDDKHASAKAAIKIVIEEAALVVDRQIKETASGTTTLYYLDPRKTAAAIRALGDKP